MRPTSIALQVYRVLIGTSHVDKQVLNHVSDTRQGHWPPQDASAYSITTAPTVWLFYYIGILFRDSDFDK